MVTLLRLLEPAKNGSQRRHAGVMDRQTGATDDGPAGARDDDDDDDDASIISHKLTTLERNYHAVCGRRQQANDTRRLLAPTRRTSIQRGDDEGSMLAMAG